MGNIEVKDEIVPFVIVNLEKKVESILQYEHPSPEGYYDEEDRVWKIEGKPLLWAGNTAGRTAGDKTWEGTTDDKGGTQPDDMGWD